MVRVSQTSYFFKLMILHEEVGNKEIFVIVNFIAYYIFFSFLVQK